MASLERKNFETEADEVSAPNNARVEPVNVLGQRVMKLTVQLAGNGHKIPSLLSEQIAVRPNSLELSSKVQSLVNILTEVKLPTLREMLMP